MLIFLATMDTRAYTSAYTRVLKCVFQITALPMGELSIR